MLWDVREVFQCYHEKARRKRMITDGISMTKHELTQEVSRVWQQYNMSFPEFIRFALSRGIAEDNQQFLRCLHVIDREKSK